MPLRDDQWRPALLVLAMPDVNPGAVRGKKLDGAGKVFVGRSVHRGFTVVIDSVDVIAEIERGLQGFNHFAFSPGPGPSIDAT